VTPSAKTVEYSARFRKLSRGKRVVRTQTMSRQEVEAALARAGLDVPEREKPEIAAAAHFIEEMAARLRTDRKMGAEPAHVFPPPPEA